MTTVVVVEKKAGRQVYVKSIGNSSNPEEIARFTKLGERYIKEESKRKRPELDFEGAEERASEAREWILSQDKRQQLIKPLLEDKYWVT